MSVERRPESVPGASRFRGDPGSRSGPGPVHSPLTDTPAIHVASVPLDGIRRFYEVELGMDLERYFGAVARLEIWCCETTGYEFYMPASTQGDARFYEEIGRHDWYYDEGRWEHGRAVERLAAARTLLDVGCGSGAFLERIAGAVPDIRTAGVELSAAAAREGRRRGLDIHVQPVEELAEQHAESFDAVVAFQVLEHLSDPRSTLEAMIRLTRPGGVVGVGVPNNDGYLPETASLLSYPLNMPPHHMGLWTPHALRALPELLPIETLRIELEPIDEMGIRRTAAGRVARLVGGGTMWRVAFRLGLHRLYRRLRRNELSRLPGHSVLAWYRKPGPDPLPLAGPR